MTDVTAIVCGGGPAGLAAACLLAQENVSVSLIAPERAPDARTVALMQPSIQLLKYLGVWPGELLAKAAPLKQLHIADDTGNTVAAPRLEFTASEIGLEEFGWNIAVEDLASSLSAKLRNAGGTIHQVPAVALMQSSESATVTLADGTSLSTKVVLAADGANSLLREKAGISNFRQDFAQTALVTSFAHTKPHQFVSTELHKRGGPFTTVPLPGNRSSLVWMSAPDEIARLKALDDEALAIEIQLASHGQLGLVSQLGPRATFAMRSQRATEYAANRVMLIGEAAHALPPLGAQGLNMSLRDVGHAVDVILAHEDPGAAAAMAEYNQLRSSDIESRMAIVKAMNGSLLTDFAPAGLLRSAGLAAIAAFPPLRSFAMRQGLASTANLPFAMRAG